MKNMPATRQIINISDQLLTWYDLHQRKLPWRAVGDEVPDPYRVWLSEIMLQQTQIITVVPYFNRFIKLWPGIKNLADADINNVLREWAGLGYYARARNMHRSAQIIAYDHSGQFPKEEAELLKLPGVGPYTAAAVAAIAFGKQATPVDGNVERVIARLHRIRTPIQDNKLIIRSLASQIAPKTRTGDYAQAVMDLGATVCTPRNPICSVCPITEFCEAFSYEETDIIPISKGRKKIPKRTGTAYVIFNDANQILLYRRSKTGLLGGMLEVPSAGWEEHKQHDELIKEAKRDTQNLTEIPGSVKHVFTHFKLELVVVALRLKRHKRFLNQRWYSLDEIEKIGLSKLMLKVVQHFKSTLES